MANERKYRVLAVLPNRPSDVGGGVVPDYLDLDVHAASDAEGACEAALAVAKGGPQDVKQCVAIPVGNWNLCDVEVETEPRYRATRVVGTPATPEPGAPEQPAGDDGDGDGGE